MIVLNLLTVLEVAKSASVVAAEKYAIKAREFCKMAAKISVEAGGKSAAECAKNEAGEEGEAEGEKVGEEAGRESGKKSGFEVFGEEGAKVGAEAGARAGRKFGFKVKAGLVFIALFLTYLISGCEKSMTIQTISIVYFYLYHC